MSLAKFLKHHVSDLTAVRVAIASILDVVPVNAQDRTRIEGTLDAIEQSAANIVDSLSKVAKGGDDSMSAPKGATSGAKAPTDAQIAKALDKALPLALAAYFEAHPVSAPAPVIAPGTPGPDARTAGEDAVGGDGTGTNGQSQHDDGTGTDVIEA